MPKVKKSEILQRIDKVTGADRTAKLYQSKGNRDVNAGRVKAGKRGGFGNTTQKREDLVHAFGGD